ncbi:holin [Paucibacter sp. O1-1]|nr:hypothetical protein [Paucibacter sp. O1-1]MCU7374959.1 hypothetical protein [Paucibacter sp. O1-1]MDA3827875.1 holin [Paucibacter sp. O1-1]MDA3829961.1 holin [Paucibacter sp. O1-1]
MTDADMHQQALAAAGKASGVMYAGGGVGGLGAVLSNEVIGLLGLLIALVGYLTNLYYKRKDAAMRSAANELEKALRIAEDRRQEVEHKARMQALRGGRV